MIGVVYSMYGRKLVRQIQIQEKKVVTSRGFEMQPIDQR